MMDIKSKCNYSTALRLIRVISVSLLLVLAWPLGLQAAEITAVTLEKSASGDVLSIKSDAELDYQSFDLSAPPRLVLTFPNSAFGKPIEGITSSQAGVKKVSTSVSKNGARLDISLSKALGYKIDQKGHVLRGFIGFLRGH